MVPNTMASDQMIDDREALPADDRLSPQQSRPPRKKSWIGTSQGLLAPFEVSAPQYRLVPLLGCLIILLNDAEFFFKQTAMFRAIESIYCIEFYSVHNASISALGRDIPERLCKADEIEKQVSSTYGWIMFCRMLPCLFTAIPLGYLADKAGRRPVLILHKLGTIVFVSVEIVVCMYLKTVKRGRDMHMQTDKGAFQTSCTLHCLSGYCT